MLPCNHIKYVTIFTIILSVTGETLFTIFLGLTSVTIFITRCRRCDLILIRTAFVVSNGERIFLVSSLYFWRFSFQISFNARLRGCIRKKALWPFTLTSSPRMTESPLAPITATPTTSSYGISVNRTLEYIFARSTPAQLYPSAGRWQLLVMG